MQPAPQAEVIVKLSVISLCSLGFSIMGCATGIVPDDPEPTSPTTKKDASAPDAKQSVTPHQDSGVMDPDTGVQDPGTDSGGQCTLMINYGSQSCNNCMQGCCAQDNACVSSQDCVDLINCLNACQPNDSTCVGNCRSGHPSGATLFDGITKCMSAQCSSSCP
jgi:hypothetical protein